MLSFLLYLSFIFLIFVFLYNTVFLRRVSGAGTTHKSFLFASDIEDDSDMKIAPDTDFHMEHEDEPSEVSEMQLQKENGNLEKAKHLGELLTNEVLSIEGESQFGIDINEDNAVREQRRILLAFTVIYSVEQIITNDIICKAVENTFFNNLRAHNYALYKNLGGTGAFSFYYLCNRQCGNIEDCIGQDFAMLSGKEGNALIEELGKTLFMRYSDVMKGIVYSVDIIC